MTLDKLRYQHVQAGTNPLTGTSRALCGFTFPADLPPGLEHSDERCPDCLALWGDKD